MSAKNKVDSLIVRGLGFVFTLALGGVAVVPLLFVEGAGRSAIFLILLFSALSLFGSGFLSGALVPKLWILSVFAAWGIALAFIHSTTASREPVAPSVFVHVEAGSKLRVPVDPLPGDRFVFIANNLTSERHTLAVAQAPQEGGVWNMCGDPARIQGYKFTLPPIEPRGAESARSKAGFLPHDLSPGRYIIFCTERAQSGQSHCEKGEIDDFMVKAASSRRQESDTRILLVAIAVSAGLALAGGWIGAKFSCNKGSP